MEIHFFKPSGKWYTSEEVPWTADREKYLLLEFAKVLKDYLYDPITGRIRLQDMIAVCIEPDHNHPFPQMLAVQKAFDLCKEYGV